MIYLQLFLNYCQISALGFGGGYAVLSLIQSITVDTYGWLTMNEFADVVTISQMIPGPIIINSAIFIGHKLVGIPGVICAALGAVTPSSLIASGLAFVYFKYKSLSFSKNMLKILRPITVGLIASASAGLLVTAIFLKSGFSLNNIDYICLSLVALAFAALRWLKVNPMLLIVVCGLARMGLYLLFPLAV